MLGKTKTPLVILLLFILVACAEGTPSIRSSEQMPSPAMHTSTATTRATFVSTSTPKIQSTFTSTATPTTSPSQSSTIQVSLIIEQLRMFDKDRGWAIGEVDGRDKILWTTEGGRSWKDVTPSLPEGNFRAEAFFADVNTAFAIYTKSFMPDSLKVELFPWQTNDNGKTWQTGETITLDFGTDFTLRQLYFLDTTHGWFLGSVSLGHAYENGIVLFETKDGGMHWEKVYDAMEQMTTTGGASVTWWPVMYPFVTPDMVFISDTAGFFTGVTTTQDGGRSWKSQSIARPSDAPPTGKPCCNDFVSLPQFLSSEDGVLIQQVYKDFPADDLIAHIYHVPDATYLQYTHDGGQTWTPQSSPAKMGTVYFLNKDIGWYLGKDDPNPSALTQLYQTADGGKTWAQIAVDCPLPLGSEIQFVDEQTGFAFSSPWGSYYYASLDSRLGSIPSIFSTNDGGRSWVKVEPQLAP